MAGGISGALSWFISFPLDCIRVGVQGQSMPPTKGAFCVYRDLIMIRGIRGLYAGSQASIIRAFLVSGSRFSAYEGALWLIRGEKRY
jgi:solute carrier family 25 carnitine/acylcarnitine transporter 20/29